MAVIWTAKISKEDPKQFRANVVFTRVDDAMVGGDFSVSYDKAVIKTDEDRKKLFDAANAMWEKEKARRTIVSNFVGNFEQAAKADLEAREV